MRTGRSRYRSASTFPSRPQRSRGAEAQAAAIAHRSLYAAACDDAAIEIEESETHYETIREIAPSENEGRATVRIHSVDDDNYRMIADNGPTSETNETLN